MGEFDTTVTTLIQAFSSGIELIKRLRRHRKETKAEVDASVKKEEQRLSRSLERNRADVRKAYTRDRDKLGDRFERGDHKAHLSLSSILFRLNAGLISIIDRFTRGESTRADYQTLVNLSNASRIDAINAFRQLSSRLSGSQLILQGEEPKPSRTGAHSKSKKKQPLSTRKEAGHQMGHLKSKSAPELSIVNTVLGPATHEGWIRPKPRYNVTLVPAKLAEPRPHSTKANTTEISRGRKSKAHGQPSTFKAHPKTHRSTLRMNQETLPIQTQGRPRNRESVMSFASDSTKLGEIPDRSWPRPVNESGGYGTAFPLIPFREPEKPRSRFMRLFSRGVGS